jgi:outer membrane protein TolC
MMLRFKFIFLVCVMATLSGMLHAQATNNQPSLLAGIDTSQLNDLTLPPLATLLEAVESNPQIEYLKSQKKNIELDLSMVKREWMGRINVSGNYSYGKGTSLNTTSGGSTDPVLTYANALRSTYGIGIGAGLPLSFFSDHAGKVKKTEELLKQSDLLTKQEIQSIKLQVVEIYTNLDMLIKSRKKTIDLLFIANSLLRMKAADYANGVIDLTEYSSIVSNQKSIQSELDATTAQIIRSKYQLEILTGVKITNQATE